MNELLINEWIKNAAIGIVFSVCPRLSSDRVYKSLFHTVLKCIARPPVLFMTIYGASPLDSKEIKPVNPKGINPEYSLKGLMLKLNIQYFGHLMHWANSLKRTLMLGKIEVRRKRGQQRMRWSTVGWHRWLYGHEFEQTPGVGEGQVSLVCCGRWGYKESDMTDWLNNNRDIQIWIGILMDS